MLSTGGNGLNALLKEGGRHYAGLEEAIIRNIDAAREISNMTRTSLGPNGMRKMVINHIEKVFVTSDAATILQEVDPHHPAAKMIAMASKMQETEYGDATNLVITFAGELLAQAEELIKQGLHPSQIVSGYEAALVDTMRLLEQSGIKIVNNVRCEKEVTQAIFAALSSKLTIYAEHLTALIAKGCTSICPENPLDFDPEYFRVGKILGGSIYESFIMKGLLVMRGAEGQVTSVAKPKIAIYSCPLQPQDSETKTTVLIKTADELLNYTKSEEIVTEKFIQSVVDAGVTCVVVGGTISELCMHYLEKYKIMCVKLTSKFELKRVCKCTGAIPVTRCVGPKPDQLGYSDEVVVQEIGSQNVTLFKRENDTTKLCTLILRGNTQNLLDDLERAVNDGVHAYRSLLKDAKYVHGAGATEVYLANAVGKIGASIKSLDQYAFQRFAIAFEVVARILIENAGMNANETLTNLISVNHDVHDLKGIDVLAGGVKSSAELKIYDHLNTKTSAIKLATDAALTILRIDQIIVAKPAGGPKPRTNNNWDED